MFKSNGNIGDFVIFHLKILKLNENIGDFPISMENFENKWKYN